MVLTQPDDDIPGPPSGERRPTAGQRGVLSVVIALLMVAALGVAWSRAGDDPSPGRTAAPPTGPTGDSLAATVAPIPTTSTTPSTVVPATIAPTDPVAQPMPGCPPPPRPPAPPGPAPWRPSVLVPETALPEPVAVPDPQADLSALAGKGMFVWKYFQSEGGDADAIVRRAVAAGLRQIWVRVGDSQDGFYAGDVLNALVPRAHAAGLAVIGWGFPYLWDPVSDADWSAQALAWRGPDGSSLDGFSPDLELATEGVVLTERRVRVYLGLVRRAAGPKLIVATVYRPSDRLWNGRYPYAAIAAYVDAFAPMVYWGCLEPGETAARSVERLAPFRPVHVIGQGYDMTTEGGRAAAPTAEETVRFLDVARRRGAVGASFWVWQSMSAAQWSALAGFGWPLP